MSVFGWWAVVFTGAVGTPVHEIGHWLGCKIFGFRVVDVALFRPFAGRYDGVLGYVTYSYSGQSTWSRIGSFVTGIAPLVFGCVVILLILRFLTPEIYRRIRDRIDTAYKKRGAAKIPSVLWAAVSGFFTGLFSLRRFGIVRGVLCLYLVTSISMHMSLSAADLKGAAAGFIVIIALYLVYGVIATLLKTDYVKHCAHVAASVAAFLSIGLVFSLIMLALSSIVAVIF